MIIQKCNRCNCMTKHTSCNKCHHELCKMVEEKQEEIDKLKIQHYKDNNELEKFRKKLRGESE